MKSEPQSMFVFAEDIHASPSCQEHQDMSHLQAGFGWLQRMSDKCSITFEYPASSMPYINFLIFWMLLLTWVLWHPNRQASVTHSSQSVVLQDQLRHGSLIRLKFINMVLALSFSKAEDRITQGFQQQLQVFDKYYLPPSSLRNLLTVDLYTNC